MNLPNKLTVLRMIMVPFFVLFMLTDMLDGKIARARNLVTRHPAGRWCPDIHPPSRRRSSAG